VTGQQPAPQPNWHQVLLLLVQPQVLLLLLLLLLLLVVQPQQPSTHLGCMALGHMTRPVPEPLLLLTAGRLLPMCLRPSLLLLLLSWQVVLLTVVWL
jgi:hypothetical protein